MRPRSPDRANGPLLVFGPWSLRYDLGSAHPLTPRRFEPGIELLRSVAGEEPRRLLPTPAPDETLQWIHEAAYVRTVQRLSDAPFGPREAGIGPGDTPAFAGMHEAAAAVAGGSVAAIEAILDGAAEHAFHPGGGLHHAMSDRAAGFCVYDDPALAIARARRDGLRVLYVDLDVHHGDGVQAIHRDDPGVLTVSIHQSGRTLFPGTGFVDEIGEGAAAGTVVNLPLEPATGERAWLAVLRQLLPELAASFGPDIVVSQHGADAHAWDPLANLRVTTTAMGAAARLVDAIAHRWAGGRWLATGGGGYDVYRVVPRTWSLVWLAALHREPGVAVPEVWRNRWSAEAERYGQSPLPTWLEDETNAGMSVDAVQEAAERAAIQTGAFVRDLTVPALIRTATDLGWWSALEDLGIEGGRRTVNGEPPGWVAQPRDGDATSTHLEIVDRVDASRWASLDLVRGTLPPLDPATAHGLISAALASAHRVRVSAAIAGGRIVGAVVSADSAADVGVARSLLGIGVAPRHRQRGIASALLRAHVGAMPEATRWVAAVTVAERDPVEPLPAVTRAAVARRLLEGAGFRVQRATGQLGHADPHAIVARR
ncbi:MAG: acetoin utilization AcuC family protein [Chloroflexota bacterium]